MVYTRPLEPAFAAGQRDNLDLGGDPFLEGGNVGDDADQFALFPE